MSGGTVTQAWPLQTHLELAALPTAPGCARDHVRSLAHEWGLPGLADTAELLVSELVTNAVQASERLKTRADLSIMPVVGLSSPAFSGLANLRLSYAVAFISRYSSMASCGVRYPIAE
jgi:hypothetical protein